VGLMGHPFNTVSARAWATKHHLSARVSSAGVEISPMPLTLVHSRPLF